jgi:HipA-like C-terminal domain
MSNEPSILEIDPKWRREIEDMGSKPKFWFRYQDEMWLFKQARPNTGEHWAEKVASEIAELLGLPTHEVEIARYEGRMGCAVKSFLRKHEILVHGNEFLAGAIKGYDKYKQRGQADHHFSNIVHTIEKWFPTEKYRKLMSLRIVGYFVLDALVGNTDRHHENWGILLKPVKVLLKEKELGEQMRFRVPLAPTYDHGSSLGRELLDDRMRLLLADPQGIQRYIRKATGGIFENAQARKGLSPMALVELISATYPDLVKPWKNRITALPEDFAVSLLARIPESCMSQASQEFVLAFLAESRKMIALIQ